MDEELSLEQKKKLYNAEKSKRSYEKRKESILKNRILQRVANGQSVNVSTIISQSTYNWTEEEIAMLNKSKENQSDAVFVPPISQQFRNTHNPDLRQKSQGFFEFIQEDNTSQSHLITKQNCENKTLTLEQAKDIFEFIANHNTKRVLLTQRDQHQRKLAIDGYMSKLKTIMDICGTMNLLDIYVHIESFHNRLLASHINISSVKAYFSVLKTLHKHSEILPPNSKKKYVRLYELIHENQIEKLKQYTKKGIDFVKLQEMNRMMTADFYHWDDYKKLVEIVKNHPEKKTIRGMRDLVILHIYVYELIMRDDLGNVRILERKNGFGNEFGIKYNYYDVKTGTLYLNQYKTSWKYGEFVTTFFQDTKELIDKYLQMMQTSMKIKPKYLITKDDGTQFYNGKLSGYITEIFNRYVKKEDITINSIRHSFVSRIKHEPRWFEFAPTVKDMMKHSFDEQQIYDRKGKAIHFIESNQKVPTITTNQRCIVTEVALGGTGVQGQFGRVVDIINTNTYVIEFRNKEKQTYTKEQYELLLI
jgi:hypothetical protein